MSLKALASLRDPTGDKVAKQQLPPAIWDDSSDDTDSSSSESDSLVPESPRAEQIPAPPKKSRFEYLLHDIAHIITCLYELSIAVQNPAARDKLHKYKNINVKHFEHFELLHARDKLPKAPQFLINRLAKANLMRRRMFEYYRKHHQKMIGPQTAPNDRQKGQRGQPGTLDIIPEGSTTQYPPPGIEDKLVSDDMPDELESLREAPPPSVQNSQTIPTTVDSYTTISTYVEPSREADLIAPDIELQSDAGTQTSFASSNGGMSRLYIPCPPRGIELDGTPFHCPYCYYIIRPKDTFSWM